MMNKSERRKKKKPSPEEESESKDADNNNKLSFARIRWTCDQPNCPAKMTFTRDEDGWYIDTAKFVMQHVGHETQGPERQTGRFSGVWMFLDQSEQEFVQKMYAVAGAGEFD